MKGFKAKSRLAVAVIIALCIGLAGLYDLLKPISNGCAMTYMYPTYIPLSTPENVSSTKYGLYLYHEGWRKIDYDEHLKKLNGVPVLFIPGNGGSYKQVRSLGAESSRAYQGGPPEHNFYQDGFDVDMKGISLPSQYSSMLDWFAVDLEGEHSAMDGRILQQHAEYVVYAIHKILDQYKESHDARVKEGLAVSGSLPKTVILVGHSMGGFVARAAIVHPNLRKFSVETVLTLSTPHQSPPLSFQPSLGHYYAHVNQEWRKGYEVQTSRAGHYMADPLLSHVAVVSISGGYNDYQVRTKSESLDGIVPHSHGFMITSTGVKNAWLSMEHQVILWCNQLVVQVSHTLLSLIDPKTGKPFQDVRQRLAIFTKMLHGGIPENFISSKRLTLQKKSNQDGDVHSGLQVPRLLGCPSHVKWSEDGLEKDLYIQTSTITVLAMDGRRRWLDITKLGSNGKDHFVFVSNLSPCSGVRLHLWTEKGNSASMDSHVLEVTSKMVLIPSGPAPKQPEPGSQTEQAPPSAVFWLGPQDMQGFRFITISVAPRPPISGRPPPVTSMGVGQFFNPKEGEQVFSPHWLINSLLLEKGLNLDSDHPLALNLTFTVSLGLLPITLSLRPTGCGIPKSEFLPLEQGDLETSRLCRRRCFPPVALAWDSTSGFHVFTNLYSQTLVVDSSTALWTSSKGEEKTTFLLLVDPHCSYKATISVSATAAAARFLLVYFSQISGLCIAVLFFALMRQSLAWELDKPVPSVLSAVESNLRMPTPFFVAAIMPILFALLLSCLTYRSVPPTISFTVVSVICYVFANGVMIAIISVSELFFYVAATVHVFAKKRWQAREGNFTFPFLHQFLNLSSRFFRFKVVRILQTNAPLITAFVAVLLVFFVHPSLGLIILLLSHTLCSHCSLASFLMASFRSHVGNTEFYESGHEDNNDTISKPSPTSSPDSTRSFGDRQLEIFHHRHGLFILHLLAALMFGPSLVAWIQRIDIGQNVPWLWDSILSTGVILHGICDSEPEFNFFIFPIPGFRVWEIRLSFVYFLAGNFTYLSALALAPYRAFYCMAAIGLVSFTFRIIQIRKKTNGEIYRNSRKHSHRH